MSSADDQDARPRPAPPFRPGRGGVPVPAQGASDGFARPFRSRGVPVTSAAPATEADSAEAERVDLSDRLPGTWIEEVTPVSAPSSTGDERTQPEVGWELEAAPGTTFAPLVSWDPLTDVGWRADQADQAAELDVEVGALAFPHTSVTEPAPAAKGTEDATPAAEGVAPEDDEFAAKLELIAEAIRGGKVEGLLSEHPQDALMALVVGYYLGTARRGDGSSGR